ncbi:MAG: DUF3185 family protein [Pseudomonadota bacterium]|nr:DUF3185 family protein [Pseudomonadota bacterium]
MHPLRIGGLVALVVGIVLVVMGYNASQSFTEELAESVTGRYSDETTWLFISGAACITLGLLLAVFGKKH